MIRTTTDVLLLPCDELALALSAEFVGRELDWADSVSSALAALGRGLRQHTALAERADGIYAKVDLTRPTLIRHINHLRREHPELMAEVRNLQEQVRDVTLAFQPRQAMLALGALPAVEARAPVPDFSAIRERGEQLLARLHRHEEEEDMIVLESVDTDIGTGD
jgi:hypothetical protein